MQCTNSFDIAILGAVSEEIQPIVPLLQYGGSSAFLGRVLWAGSYGGLRLLLAATGIGKVNAAAVTASMLQRYAIGQVWNIGSAGAYAEGPLKVGDVLITLESLCGDEGVMSSTGISSVERIGIPVAMRGGTVIHDRIGLDSPVIARSIRDASPSGPYCMEPGVPLRRACYCEASHRAPREHAEIGFRQEGRGRCPEKRNLGVRKQSGTTPSDAFRVCYGPSLTVGMSSGDAETAAGRFRRYGAFAENMEGSAVAQTCFLFDVPMAECRGISNVAGDRDRDHWRLGTAVEHCLGIVLNWLEFFSSQRFS